MRLSDCLSQIGDPFTLEQDGEFALLEQCTRIRGEGALTYLENEKYLPFLDNPRISCVICKSDMKHSLPAHIQGIALSLVPKSVFFHIHNNRVRRREKTPTRIAPSARISDSAVIAPFNVNIGENVEIQPLAVVHENVTIEDNVRICSGTVVGGQSFTAVKDAGGGMYLALDGGRVLIERGVEICGGCQIACGILDNDVTVIGADSKLDVMAYVGHGTVIGKRTLILAGAAIPGNCVIGNDAWIGVNATLSNRIEVGDGGRVSLGAVVTKNVPAGETVSGNFAIPHRRFLDNLKRSLLPDPEEETDSGSGNASGEGRTA